MVLVDTSVWVRHFRQGEPLLAELLNEALVCMHPFVIGELACGNLKNRLATLDYLRVLPKTATATPEETLGLIERRRLWGTGIGWVDAHLVASALLASCRLWTVDDSLKRVCESAGVDFAGVGSAQA